MHQFWALCLIMFPPDKHFFIDGDRLRRRLYVAVHIMVGFGCFWFLASPGVEMNTRHAIAGQPLPVRHKKIAMNKKSDRGRKQ